MPETGGHIFEFDVDKGHESGLEECAQDLPEVPSRVQTLLGLSGGVLSHEEILEGVGAMSQGIEGVNSDEITEFIISFLDYYTMVDRYGAMSDDEKKEFFTLFTGDHVYFRGLDYMVYQAFLADFYKRNRNITICHTISHVIPIRFTDVGIEVAYVGAYEGFNHDDEGSLIPICNTFFDVQEFFLGEESDIQKRGQVVRRETYIGSGPFGDEVGSGELNQCINFMRQEKLMSAGREVTQALGKYDNRYGHQIGRYGIYSADGYSVFPRAKKPLGISLQIDNEEKQFFSVFGSSEVR